MNKHKMEQKYCKMKTEEYLALPGIITMIKKYFIAILEYLSRHFKKFNQFIRQLINSYFISYSVSTLHLLKLISFSLKTCRK